DSSGVRSASVTGRRNARRARADRIFRAHAVSSPAAAALAPPDPFGVVEPAAPEPVAKAGRQTKIRARLGVSPGPVTLYGPRISTPDRCGTVVYPNCTPVWRSAVVASKRWNRSSTYAALFLTKVTLTVCGPAFIGSRTSRGAAGPPPAAPPRM